MEELEDASTECKEARGARDGIFNNNVKRKEDDKDKEDNKESEGEDRGDDPDDKEDAELALLRREMDALEHRMYSKGTVDLAFARMVTQARLAKKNLWG